jgi:hypothetical protein
MRLAIGMNECVDAQTLVEDRAIECLLAKPEEMAKKCVEVTVEDKINKCIETKKDGYMKSKGAC